MPKTPIKEQRVEERIRNFEEVILGYGKEEAEKEALRCKECGACISGCPLHVDIPSFIRNIKKGKFKEACEIILKTNPFPAITGRVCPQETQCEARCILGVNDESVAIGKLERFVAEFADSSPSPRTKTGKRVAIVGSGPSGLTCAIELTKKGHEVIVYESLHEAGGVLRYGIPSFRLPRNILERELERLKKMGVKIECNKLVGLNPTFSQLLEEFDAIYVATGAGLPNLLHIPGENLNGVYSANEFLLRINLMHANEFPHYDTPIKVGNKVAVIGGGNVAMDAARSALRLGAKEVTVVYRRSKSEMPARKEEIKHAEEEGIKFELLATPLAFHGDEKGWVKKIECVRMKLGEADTSGRRKPIPIQGSNFYIFVDSVIVAIGQSPNPLLPKNVENLKVDERGRVIVDENFKTSLKKVWAGGDITSGAATVIGAMAAGKKAAKSIHEYLNLKRL